MINREGFEEAGRRLAGWKRTMILAHDRPDGDALGAMAAIKRVIEAAGREAIAFVYDELPSRYAFLDHMPTQSRGHGTQLDAQTVFRRWQDDDPGAIDAGFDGILILDTNSWAQLKPVADYLRASTLPRIVVDHHAAADGLSQGRRDDLDLIDPSAPATCQILHAWCDAMGWALDPASAEALFTGLSTDTGWFRHSNTDARAMQTAADLIDLGVKPDVLYSRLYGSFPLSRVRLMTEMLATLTLHAGDTAAITHITPEMFGRSGASKAETEDLVNEPMSAERVIVSVLLVDAGTGEIRASFRSKSPEVCGRDIDVAAIAEHFGGGGHRRAAGARLAGTLEEARRRVTERIVAAMGGG
ncbi:MAG: DHHA1 domain-containing protein [Phycisphaerae bacterium]|nr:DHHA1 domain-containing protein [Phycisphaerae bacterium]